MNEVRHTPEPWEISDKPLRGREYDVLVVGDRREPYGDDDEADEREGVQLVTTVALFLGNATSGGIERACAERAVACVNAMAGIADPSAVKDLLAACEAIPLDCEFEDAADFVDRSEQLRRAMDAALAAIRKATNKENT